jgi:ketosteroid isomerase-like protein
MNRVTESNVELVRRGYEAVLRGDLDAIRDILDPEVKWHAGDPTAEYACHNRAQALEFMRRNWVRRGTPAGELVDVIDAGEKVVVIIRRTGEDGEPELVANLTTFRDGKVIEMVHYPDPEAARAAAGA